ncbi:unnamed protein product [Prunus armeniaca]
MPHHSGLVGVGRTSPHPPVSHFISQACSTQYTDVHGKVSWKAAHILFQLVIEQSVSAKFYVRESLIVASATNATVLTASVILPQIITALAAHAGVPTLSIDAIGSSDTIKVNNQVTLHNNDAHCTFGGFSIEQHALMDSLSTSHHVMHALLHRIWDRLDTYSELLLSFAGHIQPIDSPHPPRARSIYGSFVVLMDSFSFEVIYVFLWIS